MSKSQGNLVLVSALRAGRRGPDGDPAGAAGPPLPHAVGLDRRRAWPRPRSGWRAWRAACRSTRGPTAEATVAARAGGAGRRPGRPAALAAVDRWARESLDRGGDDLGAPGAGVPHRRRAAGRPPLSPPACASVLRPRLGTCASELGRRGLRPGLVAAPAQVALELPGDRLAARLGQVGGVLRLLERSDVLGDLVVGSASSSTPRSQARASSGSSPSGMVMSSRSSSLASSASVALGEGGCRRSAGPRPRTTATACRPGRRRPAGPRRCRSGPRTCTPRGRSGGSGPRARRWPLTGIGRVCGTSASSAPSVTNVATPTDWANSSSSTVKDRQRMYGSMPCTRTTSRSVPDGRSPAGSGSSAS